MSVILNFKKWKQIYEQEGTPAAPVDFIISAGASAKPVSDQSLNQRQNYPLPTDRNPLNHIYELTLGAALSGNFANARIISAVAKESPDQITFEGRSIIQSGTLTIEWSAAAATKLIRVSGNGALVLARAADQTMRTPVATLNSRSGILILQLSASELFSRVWSLASSGLDVPSLISSLNGRVSQAAIAVANTETKPELVKKWNESLAWVETEYSPSITKIDKDGSVIGEVYPPNLVKNDSLKPYYGTVSRSELEKGGTTVITELIRNNMIKPGLDALSAYVPEYFSGELAGLEKQYVDRLVSKTQLNITSVKNAYKVDSIKKQISRTVTADSVATGRRSVPNATTTSTTYKEGESRRP